LAPYLAKGIGMPSRCNTPTVHDAAVVISNKQNSHLAMVAS
jgi:hypothetical protein